MPRQDRLELIRKIEALRGSHLICCLTSDRPNAAGILAKDFIPVFFNHLSAFDECKKIDVFMLTPGGDTLAAFGLSRIIREFATEKVGVLIPEKCHSAGTLFALGANEIVMGRAATLTPIDPSLNSPLGPVVEMAPGQRQSVPVSVESVAGYLNLLKEEWNLKGQGLSLAFRMLAEKINPLVLGDVYRTRQQIGRLARTLLTHRKDDRSIEHIVGKLTGGLGSHDYLISRSEARELLGDQVARDAPELEDLLWTLHNHYKADMRLGQIFDVGMAVHAATAAGQRLPASDEQIIVFIESTIAEDRFERVMLLSMNQVMTPAGPTQVPQAVVVRAGWKQYS